MKPCHICERIIRIEKAYICDKCPKHYCYSCINKHFPGSTKQLVTKIQNIIIPNFKLSPCFACNKQCKCYKCTTNDFIFARPSSVVQENIVQSKVKRQLVGIQEQILEVGLFRNTQINEIPTYLQRIYLKKKAIYSKHKLFQSPAQNIHQYLYQQNNENLQGKEKNGEEQMQGKEVQQSIQRLEGKHEQIDEEKNEEDEAYKQRKEQGEEQIEGNRDEDEEDQGDESDEDSGDEIDQIDQDDLIDEGDQQDQQHKIDDIQEGQVDDPNDREQGQIDEQPNMNMIDQKMNQEQILNEQLNQRINNSKERSKIIEEALQNRKDDSSIEIQVVQ